jgi:hypothetical protein
VGKRKKAIGIPPELHVWIDARRRHRLSHAQLQMARELGMNPKKLGKIDNHEQEPWKAPLAVFIETLCFERFGRARPAQIVTIEERPKRIAAKKAARRAGKAARRTAAADGT